MQPTAAAWLEIEVHGQCAQYPVNSFAALNLAAVGQCCAELVLLRTIGSEYSPSLNKRNKRSVKKLRLAWLIVVCCTLCSSVS